MLGSLSLAGCATQQPADCPTALADARFYHDAQSERVEQLEREVGSLRADLVQAEESMVTMESGLRGVHTRADAVSAIADARIAVERAARSVPWRSAEVADARSKLDEAERQLQAGRTGSAVFFAGRAARTATTLNEEGEQVARSADTRFVNARSVNLRAGPSTDERVLGVLHESTPVFPERRRGEWVLVRTLSGPVGWIHASLLGPR